MIMSGDLLKSKVITATQICLSAHPNVFLQLLLIVTIISLLYFGQINDDDDDDDDDDDNSRVYVNRLWLLKNRLN